MTDLLIRYTTPVTGQASASISSDSLSGGSKTEISLVSGGNADGAYAIDFEVNVTSKSGTPYCEIWCEPLQFDGAGNSAPFMCARVWLLYLL